MKLLSFFIIGLLLWVPAYGEITVPAQNQYLPVKNILKNPGFENGKLYWTASGGTFSISTSSSIVGSGNAAAVWTPSSSSQTFISSAVTVPAGLSGVWATARCNFKTTNNNTTIQAYNGSSAVSSSLTIATSSSYLPTSVNFIMPSSGTIAIELISGASTSAIDIDDCYIGEMIPTNGGAQFYGSVFTPTTSGCAWTGTSSSFANLSAQSSCPVATASGNASAPATKIPAITFANGLTPGRYLFLVQGVFYNSTGNQYCSFRISDGTNVGGTLIQASASGQIIFGSTIIASFLITANTSSITYQLQQLSTAGTTCNISADSNLLAANANQFDIEVYKFPL